MRNFKNLIFDKSLQRKRVQEKREKITSWLACEGYSNCEILSQVIGLKGHGAHACLKALERDQLVRSERLPTGSKMETIYGLTPHGAGVMFEPGESANYFEPGKVSSWSLHHSLAIQKLRLHLESAGWTEWRTERQLKRASQRDGWLKVPDVLARSPSGEVVAIEVERSYKSLKRYPEIMAAYLQMAKALQIERIQYWCAAPVKSSKMQAIFEDIKQIKIKGQVVSLEQKHYDLFQFFNI